MVAGKTSRGGSLFIDYVGVELSFYPVVKPLYYKSGFKASSSAPLGSIEITGANAAFNPQFRCFHKSSDLSGCSRAFCGVLHRWRCRSLDYPSNITQFLYKGNPLRHRSALYKKHQNPSLYIRAPYQTSAGASFGVFPTKMPRRSGALITKPSPLFILVLPNQAQRHYYL